MKKTSDNQSNEEDFNSVYSSKRRLQRRVLSLEKMIAQNIYNFQKYNSQDFSFESSYAFLTCWKFPKVDFKKPTFWCDAIYFESFKMLNNRTFIFQGNAWIGPFPDEKGRQWKVTTSGRFTINAKGTRLKSYDLYFENTDQLLHLCKRSK